MSQIINKTMDRSDLDRDSCAQVVSELNELVAWLKEAGLQCSSWFGSFDVADNAYQWANRGFGYQPLPDAVDDVNFPWFLYWEIAWLVSNTAFSASERVLDLGGSSSLFSYYLASKGLDVTTVDLQPDLVDNANHVADRTGWWLSNHVMDMRNLQFAERFDHITSVCVFEHIPISARIEIGTKIRELLVPGGSFSITFDFGNPSRAARIDSPTAVREQFVEPSQLTVRGNDVFQDNGQRYLLNAFFHPNAWRYGWKPLYMWRREFGLRDLFRIERDDQYTFGALFMERTPDDA